MRRRVTYDEDDDDDDDDDVVVREEEVIVIGERDASREVRGSSLLNRAWTDGVIP